MANNNSAIPLDIIHLICDELAARNDFDSLYNCVISSRYVATGGAVNSLYRVSHECFTSASRARDRPEEAALASQILQKTAILWRSIIVSALDEALFPYCQYLRVLDVRDLGGLLDDPHFSSPRLSEYFFKGPMSRFLVRQGRVSKAPRKALDIPEILLRISNLVLTKAPLIESLSEPSNATFFVDMLPTYTQRLSHLRQLDLASGDVLTDPNVRADLRKNCPNLQAFRIFSYKNDDADANLADFLNGLKAGNLTHFENFSQCGIKEETCAALSRHGKSLLQLKLTLDEAGFKAIPKLADCTALETLSLQGNALPLSLKILLGDEFQTTINWLKRCDALYEVFTQHVPFAGELVTPIVEAHNDLLRILKIEANESTSFMLDAHMGLSHALAEQRKLEVLSFDANADNATNAEREIFLEDICAIESLRHLELRRACDRMHEGGSDDILGNICNALPNLEYLYYTAPVLGDNAIGQVEPACSNLKTMTLAGVSDLGFAALSAFVNKLSDNNTGFALAIEYADPDNALSEAEQQKIRDQIAAKVGGSFAYALIRDEADLYSESDFSD